MGTFKIGRKGKQSRIEWNSSAEKLIRDTHQLAISKCSEGVDEDRSSHSMEHEIPHQNKDLWIDNAKPSEIAEEHSNANEKIQETALVREVLEKSFSNQQQNNSLSKINISVKIDITDWEIDKITAFFKASQGIFAENDEL
ncbi:MAG: hypothetical protein AAFN00_15825 [Cyanobacteria bacterium J06558_2]